MFKKKQKKNNNKKFAFKISRFKNSFLNFSYFFMIVCDYLYRKCRRKSIELLNKMGIIHDACEILYIDIETTKKNELHHNTGTNFAHAKLLQPKRNKQKKFSW